MMQPKKHNTNLYLLRDNWCPLARMNQFSCPCHVFVHRDTRLCRVSSYNPIFQIDRVWPIIQLNPCPEASNLGITPHGQPTTRHQPTSSSTDLLVRSPLMTKPWRLYTLDQIFPSFCAKICQDVIHLSLGLWLHMGHYKVTTSRIGTIMPSLHARSTSSGYWFIWVPIVLFGFIAAAIYSFMSHRHKAKQTIREINMPPARPVAPPQPMQPEWPRPIMRPPPAYESQKIPEPLPAYTKDGSGY